MALTAAQKKALADAQALLKKQKANLTKLEAEQAALAPQSTLNKFRETEAQNDSAASATTEQSDTALATKAGPAPVGTFLGYDYQGNTQQTGTLRRKIIADGKGGQKIDFQSTEKNPDYVSGSRGGGGGSGGGGGGGNDGGGGGDGGGGDTTTTATTYTAPDGKIFTDLNAYNTYIADLKQQEKTKAGQSAYDLLFTQFQQFGMGALVEPLKQFIQQGLSSSEFTLRLRDTDAYKKRFAANAIRIGKGLSALNEAEYIGLEDQYQNIMRQYGLPASYYTRGDMGRQEGFEKFLANDVSAAELEDRVMTAQSRVTNANPEVRDALKQFYPGIGDGDILAYTLDPEKALTDIKRKITAAEIGGAAMQRGLGTSMTRAEELGAAGVTKQQAQQGFGTIAGGLQRGSQLAAIYGESPYTQTTAESEIFNIAGSTEAEKQRKKLTSLERATFSGQSGASSSALVRDRAGAY